MRLNKRKIKKATKSLVRKGYLKEYPNNEIGLTEKGLKEVLKLRDETE